MDEMPKNKARYGFQTLVYVYCWNCNYSYIRDETVKSQFRFFKKFEPIYEFSGSVFEGTREHMPLPHGIYWIKVVNLVKP